MKWIITLWRKLHTARLTIAAGSMLALIAPASAVSMSADKDTETNDRPADMRAIYSIEDRAEAIAEGEKVGDVAIVAGRESIAKWPSLRATLAQKGASAQELTQMNMRMNELARRLHDSRGLKRAANDVTGALAPLFRIVGEKIPADVHSLDYLGRSIGLDASMVQWSRASRDAYALDRAWLHLKPIIAAKANSGKVVLMFNLAVRQARDGTHDRNAKETQTGATAVGNAVDAVEGLYK
ncbi:MAG: hypothetical protein M3126_11615 [Candidatus Eremiobacteraeota bacterium]|nr:hypothetical protein [Candidatus Eremiobacteraeota bacterium]